MRPAILFLGRSEQYYYEKAPGREEALQYSLAGVGAWLNLTRAVGKLQTSHAHQSMQNDLAHSTGSAILLRKGCVRSYGRKTVSTHACCGRCFDAFSSRVHARRVWCILIEATTSKTLIESPESAAIKPIHGNY